MIIPFLLCETEKRDKNIHLYLLMVLDSFLLTSHKPGSSGKKELEIRKMHLLDWPIGKSVGTFS